MSILIVDDDDLLRETLKMFVFEFAGKQAEDAVNGSDALIKLSQEKFDLMVTDWDMPVMNGGELINKASELYPDMKIIVFSGSTIIPEQRKQGVEYLRKPIDHDKLASLIVG